MSMFFAVPILLLSLCSVGLAVEPEVVPRLDLHDPAALREAIRLLDEEVKLAARPQPYVVIDLVDRAVLIKGRGIELHRLPVEQWSASHLEEVPAVFRLRERPPVSRRKIDPAVGADQPPISLEDMPTEFTLSLSPSLTVTVQASGSGHFWRRLSLTGRAWWNRIRDWTRTLATGEFPPPTPSLALTLAPDHAQSLAWSVTETMPFLLRRAAPP